MRRKAFTLIEVLCVIGILVLLTALVAYGLGIVAASSRHRQTDVTLSNLRSMVAELEASAGLKGRQPAFMWVGGTFSPPVATLRVWEDAEPSDADADPAIIPAGAVTTDSPTRFDSDVVRNTQQVMTLLLSVPKNRTALSSVSGGKASLPDLPDDAVNNRPYNESLNPVLLDAWGGIVLFVPAGGLCGDATTPMTVGDKRVVAVPAAGEVGPIRPADRRPFWASAGPDGNFATGDDNVYSF